MGKDYDGLKREQIDELIGKWKKAVEGVEPKKVNYFVISYKNSGERILAYKTSVTEDIGENFINTLKESVTSLSADNAIGYDNTDGIPEGTFEISPTLDIPNFNKVINAVNDAQTYLTKDIINGSSSFKYVIKIEKFFCFGNIMKRKIMNSKKRILKINTEGKFEMVEDVTYLEVPISFQALSLENDIIIFDDREFEDIFKYHEKIIKTIEEKDTDIKKIFSDPEAFILMTQKDSRKARKIYNTFKSDYLKDVSPKEIEDYANEYNLKVILDKETGKISVKDCNPWHLVSALSEDFYSGKWSKRKLVAWEKGELS